MNITLQNTDKNQNSIDFSGRVLVLLCFCDLFYRSRSLLALAREKCGESAMADIAQMWHPWITKRK